MRPAHPSSLAALPSLVLALACAGADDPPEPPVENQAPAHASSVAAPGPPLAFDGNEAEMFQALEAAEPIVFEGIAQGDAPRTAAVEIDAGSRAAIEALGLDATTAEARQGWIVVEGDILLDPEMLRAGQYEPLTPVNGAGESVTEKGYRSASKINSTNDGNVKLTADASFASNSTAVWAALVAAASWSLDNTLDIDPANTGPSIHIAVRSNPPCSSDALACAAYPSGGKPGGPIYLRNDITGVADGCQWSLPILLRVLSHEMGHAIGFTHPTPLEGTHISGTAQCAFTGGLEVLCTIIPTYETIMSATPGDIQPDCSVPNPWLTDDDYDSSAALY